MQISWERQIEKGRRIEMFIITRVTRGGGGGVDRSKEGIDARKNEKVGVRYKLEK